MPTYEYACKSCGEHLEVVQSFKDEALTECPHCHGQLRKVFGNIGIAFKGSGFYKTDSRATSSASKPAEPASSSGGETKPAAADGKSTSSGGDSPASAGSGSSPAPGSSSAAKAS